jgi:hypothetical protein
VEPQDESILDARYAHTKAIRRFLRTEARIRNAKIKARAEPLSAEKLDAILSAVVADYEPRTRPTLKQIAKAARCSLNVACEARKALCVAGRWPYPDQAETIAGRVSRATTLQAPSTRR